MFHSVAFTQMSLPLRAILGSPQPSQTETEQEGRLLLSEFVTEQIRINQVELEHPENNPEDPTSLVYSHLSAPSTERIPEPEEILQAHPMFREAGRELSILADEFARSREREQVKRQAERIRVNSITKENLMALMTELFHDGFTGERLVTLFFFCSDLIIKALRETQEGGGVRWEILAWVWEFFCKSVCAWVHRKGGWEKVLCNYVPKAVMVVAGVAITAGVAFHIWKKWN
ncbi:apoptosis regulator BAX-like [Tropilaelaps mercedesae]|uniref:Apoptosis regulator BAX-like n=1 Tax=Tropilaelaps mercedesae TaxID=418985 RepID=A0A1V9XE74_9ACAR|nr:apoptosis regulator BAX-like [Tropilaelaps mercedesae]